MGRLNCNKHRWRLLKERYFYLVSKILLRVINIPLKNGDNGFYAIGPQRQQERQRKQKRGSGDSSEAIGIGFWGKAKEKGICVLNAAAHGRNADRIEHWVIRWQRFLLPLLRRWPRTATAAVDLQRVSTASRVPLCFLPGSFGAVTSFCSGRCYRQQLPAPARVLRLLLRTLLPSMHWQLPP